MCKRVCLRERDSENLTTEVLGLRGRGEKGGYLKGRERWVVLYYISIIFGLTRENNCVYPFEPVHCYVP